MRYVVINLAIALCCCGLAIADPGIELQLAQKSLVVGESVDFRLVCTDTGVPNTPTAVVPDGLKVELLSPSPSQFQSVSIIQGRRTEKTTYTYSMRLTASREGVFTFGPIHVEADGNRYQAGPVDIVVKKPVAMPKADSLAFAELIVEPRSVYVTQPVKATLRIGIRTPRYQGRDIEADLVRATVDFRKSQLSVFADKMMQGQYRSSRSSLIDAEGNRNTYQIYSIEAEVTPEQAGELTIGPIFARINFPNKLRRSIFGQLEIAASQPTNAPAPAVVVNVKNTPEEGRPDDYRGAIGKYNLTVSAKPTRVEAGQPITLSISVHGNPLDGIAGPNLAAQPELASRFDFTDDELVGEFSRNAKVFRKAIFPKQEGKQTIPPLSLSYFDLDREEYITLKSKPISIIVDPPSYEGETISLGDNTTPEQKAQTLTVVAGGIHPNYVDPVSVLASQEFILTPVWLSLLVVPPPLCLAITLIVRRRERLRNDGAFARRRTALSTANRAISAAQRAENPGDVALQASQALAAFVADWYNLPPGQSTPTEIREALTKANIPTEDVNGVVNFIEECEMARYAGADAGGLVSQDAPAVALKWIRKIGRN